MNKENGLNAEYYFDIFTCGIPRRPSPSGKSRGVWEPPLPGSSWQGWLSASGWSGSWPGNNLCYQISLPSWQRVSAGPLGWPCPTLGWGNHRPPPLSGRTAGAGPRPRTGGNPPAGCTGSHLGESWRGGAQSAGLVTSLSLTTSIVPFHCLGYLWGRGQGNLEILNVKNIRSAERRNYGIVWHDTRKARNKRMQTRAHQSRKCLFPKALDLLF